MVMVFNGSKWRCGKWQDIKYCTVKNKNNQLWEQLQIEIDRGDRDPDDNGMSYFLINGKKYTLDNLLNRYGIMGFDSECIHYPKQINCYTDDDIFNPAYCEVDEYGEKLRVWEEIEE